MSASPDTNQPKWERIPIWTGILLALGYGLVSRLIFGARFLDGFLSTLSIGFLGFVPLAVGALTVYFAPLRYQIRWRTAIFAPWPPSLVFLGSVILFNLEVFICIIMAAPIFFIMASIGGVIMCIVLRLRRANRKMVSSLLAALLLAPYLITPLEKRFSPQDSIRTVSSEIVINASPEIVWDNIIRVSKIQPEEQSFSLFHLFGIPRPLEAMMDGEGAGSIRHGIFEYGLSFVETITDWRPGEAVSFEIDVDRRIPVTAPFTEIGGKYFDVIDASYRIEPVDEKQVVLHLSSHHRLSTNFNFYGGLWTDFILSDFQSYVLQVVKRRAEKTASGN